MRAKATMGYPMTRRANVREAVGGLTIDDPYRWLEADNAETLEWDEAQVGVARAHITEWPHYQALKKQLAHSLGSIPSAGFQMAPIPCGDRWLRVSTRPNSYPQLMLSGVPLAEGEIIFDPNQLPESELRLLKWVVPSPDGRLVAVGMGERPVRAPTTLRVLDVESGQLLHERIDVHVVFDTPRVAWLPDSRSFYYLGNVKPGRVWRPACVLLHRIGDRARSEPEIILDKCWSALQVSADGRYAAVLQDFSIPRADYVKDLRARSGWRPFLSDVKGRCQGVFAGDDYVAITTENAPKGCVVSIPVARATDRRTWTELIPQGDKVARFLQLVEDRLIVGLLDDSGCEIGIFHLDGTPDGTVPLPEAGFVVGAGMLITSHETSATPYGGGFSFLHNTYTSTPSMYRFDLATRDLEQMVHAPSLGPLRSKRLECISTDGARVPIHIVYRPDLDLTEPRPTLMSGYGNFNAAAAAPPAAYLPFLDAGGIYAWVVLRGDGVFGTDWWDQGRLKKKRQSSSDFIAAAEFLVDQGIAAKERLAIIGASGGGILTATSVTRRPDLFRVVVSAFPQTDFFRNATEPYVHGWFMHEWGDPNDPEMVHALAAWSPYHNVRDGECYPATLFVCWERDDLMNPWQSRKMVAALQHASSSDAPILYRCIKILGEDLWGSGEAMVVEPLAFVMRHLGMKPLAALENGE